MNEKDILVKKTVLPFVKHPLLFNSPLKFENNQVV